MATSRMRVVAWLCSVAILGGAVVFPRAAGDTQSSRPDDVSRRLVASAQALLATLDDAGRQKVQFPFDSPQKARWSNFPSPMFQRAGLRLKDLTPTQREIG